MPDDPMTPFQVFAAASAISSFGGLAALLRSNKPLTFRAVASAIVYSAIMGLVISLVWYNYIDKGNPYLLLGISGLAGIGGVSVLDFVFQLLRKGGVYITIRPKVDEEDA